MNKQYRYPGPSPFSGDQRHIFFGRDRELQELASLVRRIPWLVLYGKSGLGKSSLLNAGLAPKLAEKDGMNPRFIRFEAWTKERKDQPLDLATAYVRLQGTGKYHAKWSTQKMDSGRPVIINPKLTIAGDLAFLENLCPNDTSLWRALKEQAGQTENQPPLLLIFDQFEELFTFPTDQVESFARSLAEVFYTDIPERYRLALEQNPGLLTEAQVRQLHEPLRLHVITAIRTDRMAGMHALKPFLPNTLDHVYQLKPLSVPAAEEAILNPAYDPDPDAFRTPRFDYDDPALDALLQYLSAGRTQEVEPFQLQILCEHVEKNIVEKEGRTRVQGTDLEDPEAIVKNYYLEKISDIADPKTQRAVRLLLEEGLVQEGDPPIRLTLHEAQIQNYYGISPALLETLVNQRLLRAEVGAGGGYNYELPHDTLLAPVLDAKAQRREFEQREAEIQAELDRQTELAAAQAEANRERRRRQAIASSLWVVIFAAALALMLALFAYKQMESAQQATNKANASLRQALQEQITRYELEIEASKRKIGVYEKAHSDTLVLLERGQLGELSGRLDSARAQLGRLRE